IWTMSAAGELFDALSSGGVRTAAVLRAQTPDTLAAIREAVTRQVEGYRSDSGYAVPMPAVLASGTRRAP
ncbi:MAG: class I SAM-dependent methyltransferase, partial [Vicinamibacterales bacterium]